MGMEKQQDCPCRGKTLMRFVQPIILAVLWESPCHGYRLIQKIARTKLWYGVTPDPAGIYRTLRDMERRGLIVSQRVLDGGKGHECRSFSITEAGGGCHKSYRFGPPWVMRGRRGSLLTAPHRTGSYPDGKTHA